jgi:hypothetical protein
MTNRGIRWVVLTLCCVGALNFVAQSAFAEQVSGGQLGNQVHRLATVDIKDPQQITLHAGGPCGSCVTDAVSTFKTQLQQVLGGQPTD